MNPPTSDKQAMATIMKPITLFLWICGLMLADSNVMMAAESNMLDSCPIIPKPLKAEYQEGRYMLSAQTVIHVGADQLMGTARYLSNLLSPATGFPFEIKTAGAAASDGIVLMLDPSRRDLGEEGYLLRSTPDGVMITAANPAGVFYGVQSLRQLLPQEIERREKTVGMEWSVPFVSIEDRPRFKWRGYMIDPARNFRTKDELKRYIDLLALHKLNIFHLHLTDDQGWRIEIKKYPKLVEIGSRLPDYSGKKGDGWFYSQQDIREIVQYASERQVTVVPEIEMPGHCGSVLAAYPELACGGKPPTGWSKPLCVVDDAAFVLMTHVLDEVTDLFPSPYIHVGADEVPAAHWRSCKKSKALMDKLADIPLPPDITVFHREKPPAHGYFNQDIARLQGEFIRRIDHYLTSRGRRMVG